MVTNGVAVTLGPLVVFRPVAGLQVYTANWDGVVVMPVRVVGVPWHCSGPRPLVTRACGPAYIRTVSVAVALCRQLVES